MKKIAGLLLCGCLLFISFISQAQTYAESALIFSRIKPGGSARIQGMGGAQTSLGGDYSSAYSNPAGLGMFNRNEFTLTPGFSISKTSSDYLDNTSTNSKSKLIIPGLSAVFHKNYDRGSLVGGTFGISLNRTNDFNRTFSYQGTNADNSLIDSFVGNANSYKAYPSNLFNSSGSLNNGQPNLYNTLTELAWDNYLLNANSDLATNPVPGDSSHYGTDVLGKPFQHETVQTSGSQYQLNLAYGLNLKDMFFIGAGVGITTADYTSKKTYSETFGEDPLRSFTLTENLNSSATGINATLGTIIRPVNFFQVGLSIATPTAYLFTDNYGASMSSNWSNFPYGATAPKPVAFDLLPTNYTLATPWRFNSGITFILGKYGLITADAEFVNYAGSRYSSQTDEVDLGPDNSDIKSLYHSVLNLRAGAEFRLDKFRVRGGYSLLPNPYSSVQNDVNAKINSYSFGGGYRTTKFYIDFALVLSQGNTTYRPYLVNSPTSPLVVTKNTNTTAMVTVGFPISR
jgi:hypothetical protein